MLRNFQKYVLTKKPFCRVLLWSRPGLDMSSENCASFLSIHVYNHLIRNIFEFMYIGIYTKPAGCAFYQIKPGKDGTRLSFQTSK